MFWWLNPIANVVSSVAGIFTKKIDADLEKYKVDGQVDINAVNAQISLIKAFKDDWTIVASRFCLIFLPSVWFGLVGWDTIMAEAHPEWMWHVAKFPEELTYYPYAVLVFLLGNAWIKRQ